MNKIHSTALTMILTIVASQDASALQGTPCLVNQCRIDSIDRAFTNWSDSVTINRFDPDLGTLTDVSIKLQGTGQGLAQYESTDLSAGTATIDFEITLTVFRPGGVDPITSVFPSQQFIDNPTAHDGTIDFAGSSGQTYSGIFATDSDTQISTGASPDLALFTGTAGPGPPGTITLPVTATNSSTATGPGNIVFQFISEASAVVEICYFYTATCNPSFCNGDGGDQMGCMPCPCMNEAPVGTVGGCLNSANTSARLNATGDLSASLPPGIIGDLRFSLTKAPPTAFCILNSGDAIAPQNMANPCFGQPSGLMAAAFDGLRCAVLNTRRHGGRIADSNGDVGVTNNPWGGEAGPTAGIAHFGADFVAGQTRYFQVINRDDPLLGCMRALNTSQAIEITFTP